MMRGYYYGYPDMMGGGWGLLMLLFWLVVIALVVLLVVWAVRHADRSHGVRPPAPPAEAKRDEACEIARTRFARGEIAKEEYEEICRTLGV